jgi:hypothetical protein
MSCVRGGMCRLVSRDGNEFIADRFRAEGANVIFLAWPHQGEHAEDLPTGKLRLCLRLFRRLLPSSNTKHC